jgi:hypothetical protein
LLKNRLHCPWLRSHRPWRYYYNCRDLRWTTSTATSHHLSFPWVRTTMARLTTTSPPFSSFLFLLNSSYFNQLRWTS